MTREAAEAIARTEFVSSGIWGPDHSTQHIIESAIVEPDRDYVAHELWALGAALDHTSCPYGGPDPADADYENNCGPCREHLLDVADRIITALSEGEGS